MIKLGYLFTSDSVDRQVDHRIYRLIWVAVDFWGGEAWVSACHHCRVVPDDEDTQSLGGKIKQSLLAFFYISFCKLQVFRISEHFV